MGTPGVPFNVPKERILEAIKKRKGVITYMCKDLDAHHGTILRAINSDPDLKRELDEARNQFCDQLCDMAENKLLHALAQDNDLTNSLSSAKFVLNNLGKKRGYNFDKVIDDLREQANAIARQTIREIENERRTIEIDRSKVAYQQPLLDQGYSGEFDQIPDEQATTDPLERSSPFQVSAKGSPAWDNNVFVPPVSGFDTVE